MLGFEGATGSNRLVITAPHGTGTPDCITDSSGGTDWIPGVPKRCCPGCCTVEDSFTGTLRFQVMDRAAASRIC